MGEKPLAKAIREARLKVIYKNSPVGERKTEKKDPIDDETYPNTIPDLGSLFDAM